MWISRAHYALIAEKAKEFRQWHEDRVRTMHNEFAERLAERDTIIARQDTRIQSLDEERKELAAQLIKKLEARFAPVPQGAEPEAEMPDWMKAIKDQVDEVKDDAQS
jgi:seryl-tRNA synthetase